MTDHGAGEKGMRGMSGKARKGRDRLGRIAALLLSLASLAECAAGRSAPVRFIVLWLLRQAETVAADFVAGTEPNAALREHQVGISPDHAGYTTADALALALSLRLLALGVQAMAAEAHRLPDEARISGCVEHLSRIVLALKTVAPPMVELCDTS